MTRRRSLQRRTTIEEIESWTRTENKKEDNKDNDDNDVVSVGSLSTVEDLLQEDPLLMAVEDSIMAVEDSLLPPEEENESLLLQPPPPPLPEVVKFPRQQKTLDVAKYMAEREMTPMQERMNALTMIPNPIYCFYFIVASLWLSDMQEDSATSSSSDNASDASCLEIPLLPRLHAMPPLTIMAIALGITLHAPFSFLYHWKYASSLPPGLPRTNHWSRRMDQSFIHVCSALMAFGTTGSWDYFFVNVLFNCDCIYRQFKKKVRVCMCDTTCVCTSWLNRWCCLVSSFRFVHEGTRSALVCPFWPIHCLFYDEEMSCCFLSVGLSWVSLVGSLSSILWVGGPIRPSIWSFPCYLPYS